MPNFDSLKIFFETILFPNLIAFIIGGIFAFLPARYSATKPRKLEIKEQQFKNIYLPLQRRLKSIDFNSDFDMKNMNYLSEEISLLIDNEFELVFPTLIETSDELSKHCKNNDVVMLKRCLKKLKYDVETEYLLLKRALGYPSLSTFALFRRLPPKRKISNILFILTMFLTNWSFIRFNIKLFFNGHYVAGFILILLSIAIVIFAAYNVISDIYSR